MVGLYSKFWWILFRSNIDLFLKKLTPKWTFDSVDANSPKAIRILLY